MKSIFWWVWGKRTLVWRVSEFVMNLEVKWNRTRFNLRRINVYHGIVIMDWECIWKNNVRVLIGKTSLPKMEYSLMHMYDVQIDWYLHWLFVDESRWLHSKMVKSFLSILVTDIRINSPYKQQPRITILYKDRYSQKQF